MSLNHQISVYARILFKSPVILLSDSFEEGRYNKPYGGGDWNEYRRGANERDWNERARQDNNSNTNRRGSNPGNNPGNGDGCGGIMVFFFVLMIGFPSAVSALPGSIAMILASGILLPSLPKISFQTAYIGAFWTIFTYFIIAIILAFLQTWFYPYLTGGKEEFSVAAVLKYFYFYKAPAFLSTITLIEFHLLCVVLSALMLRNKIATHFKGFAGYGLAVLTTAFIMLPSLLITLHFAYPLVMKFLVSKYSLL